MNKRLLAVLSVLLVLGLILSACKTAVEEPVVEEAMEEETMEEEAVVEEAEEEEEAEEAMAAPTQVQFCTMYSTSITENGWDRSGHESFMRFQADPGMDIEVLDLKWTEGLWGDEAEAAMRAFAEGGCDIIWAMGGYNDIINNVRDDYPEVMFQEVNSGLIDARDNNYHLMHRCHDGSYLMGVLAALMSEGTAIGATGGFPAEDVNDNINGFFAGAKSVKPELKQKVGFINSWYDPVAAGELAEAQKAAGVDNILMMAENFDVCGEGTGAMCYGPYIDFSEFYPGAVMASFTATWEPGYEWTLQQWVTAKVTGEWAGGPYQYEFTMKDGACDVVLGAGIEETLPPEVLQQFNETRDAILDGSLVIEVDISEPLSE